MDFGSKSINEVLGWAVQVSGGRPERRYVFDGQEYWIMVPFLLHNFVN